jgi:hypothetical protein
MGPVSEHPQPLRLDQVRGSSATANEATRQFTQSFDVESPCEVSICDSLADQARIGTHRKELAA